MMLTRFFTGALALVFFIFLSVVSVFADISSVGFVHASILELKDITVPVEGGIDASQINSVRYMLRQIDRANAILGTTTSYATGADAVSNPTTTVRVLRDIENLIVSGPELGEFNISLNVSAGDYFVFSMEASGEFLVKWGDGTQQVISKPDTTREQYYHKYETAGKYVASLSGLATGYCNWEEESFYMPTINFSIDWNSNIVTGISGSLGRIFPTLPSGSQPRFLFSFYDLKNLTGQIPADLFDGIYGPPDEQMFLGTFYGCSGLSGSIPSGLFGGLSGTPAVEMFAYTFYGCSGLSGSIPSDLFGDVNGQPAKNMFAGTFSGCTGLTGSVPRGLFGNLSGEPANEMFLETFYGCTGLTGIDDGIWDFVNDGDMISTGGGGCMFARMFSGCTGITSRAPGLGPLGHYGGDIMLWNYFGVCSVYDMFEGCVNMADYDEFMSLEDRWCSCTPGPRPVPIIEPFDPPWEPGVPWEPWE